jgi:integral membrane protein (TIGR01906 family)
MKSKKQKTNYTIPKEEKEEKKRKKVIFALLIIVVFLNVMYLFLSSFSSTIYDRSIYEKLEAKNTNFNESFAVNKSLEVVDYLQKEGKLDETFFNSDEISHFQDVKNLIKKGFIFYYVELFILFMVFVFYYEYSKKGFAHSVSRILIFSGIATILIVVLLFLVNFSSLFDSFHVVFFEGNYSFPENSSIIKLFPEEFFSGFFRIIIMLTLFKAIILLLLGLTINSLDYFRRLFSMRRER